MDIADGGALIIGGIFGFILMWGFIKKIMKNICLFIIVFILGCGLFSMIGIGPKPEGTATSVSNITFPVKEEVKEEPNIADTLLGDFSEFGDAIKGLID